MTATLERTFRAQIRELLAEWDFTPRCDAWLRGYDPDFSRALAARGWIGMTWPVDLGGAERSNRERLILTEELLRAGAPVAGHWMGDRQIGPAILRYGAPELQRRYLPRIAAGEVTFCLGMSETESGSDLASVRTTAVRVDGGWQITGQKIWTSHAHRATHAYVLARTDRDAERHAGLSEFVVDLASDGVSVRPILDLRGDHHFNEVAFTEVFVPDDHVLGTVGNGWQQVTEQLAFERGGMERVLSTYPLLAATARAATDIDLASTGRALATLATLRRLALHVAEQVDAGVAPVLTAAVLKDVGTLFEQDVNELGRAVLGIEPDPTAGGAAELLADGILAAPGFTIRGGVTAVLRTIIARSARPGQTVATPLATDRELRSFADDVLRNRGGEPEPLDSGAWRTVVDLGWPGVGLPEEVGGSGGELRDLLTLVQATGRHAVSVPLTESAAAGLLVGAAVALPATVVVPRPGERLRIDESGAVLGTVSRVPWGCVARTLVVVADGAGGPVLALVSADAAGLDRTPGTNLAGEPRDKLRFGAAPATVLGAAGDPLALLALLRSARTFGALEAALEHTMRHVTLREQFGRRLVKFQDVALTLARMLEQVTMAGTALQLAIEGGPARAPVAAVTTARAATEVARCAHQLHGAMGVTREHPLHLLTRRLWSWRDECGSEQQWASRIGQHVRGLADDPLWDWVTGEDA